MPVKPTFAVGLDAGSRKTRVAICLLEKGRIRYLGHGAAPSHGWNKGRIADQKAVADSIVAALREAEARAGVSVDSAVVGIGGLTVRGANSRGAFDSGYVREIEQRDINRAVDRAARVQLQDDRFVLQLFVQDFVVDEQPGYRDPRKMMASQLEANVHLITASIQEHNSLIGAVNQAHLSVEETVFDALAACYAAVLPEERRAGIAVVDIGAQSTEMVVYFGDALHLACPIRICGDHFTRDMAQALCLSFDEAETVKLEYGGAQAESRPENVWVELPAPENRERRETTLKFINQVLQARGEEFFRFVHSELARVGMEHALLGGVFLTGGGALLPDLCDIGERVLHCETRYGLPTGIQDWPEEVNNAGWSVAAGLAMYSAKLKDQAERQREVVGWLGRILK